MKRLLCAIGLSCAMITVNATTKHLQVSITGVPNQYQHPLQSALSLNQHRTFALNDSLNLQTTYQKGFQQLRLALQQHGYFNPSITGTVKYKNETHTWSVRYTILLGKPIMINQVDLHVIGTGKIKSIIKRYLTTTTLQKGQRLDLPTYDTVKNQLLLIASQYGYFDATLTQHQVRINRTHFRATIVLTLDAGTRYLIGKTHFTQKPNILSTAFLKRFLPYQAGQPFNNQHTIKLQRALDQSNYYAGVVITPHPNQKTKTVPITAHLRARKPFEYSLGAGYGTDTGIRGLLGWKWRYSTRSGQYFNAQIESSRIYTIFSANYVIPGNDPLKEATRIHASHGQTDISAYNATETIAGIAKTILIGKVHTTLGLSQRWIRYSTTADGKDSNVHYIMPVLSLRYRNRFRPQGDYWHEGWSIAFTSTGTVKNPLSSSTFGQASAEFREAINLTPTTRLFSRQTLGGIFVPGAITDLSPTLRYYAGGTNSIRGFDFKSLSPKDTNNNLIGGRYMLTGSINIAQRIAGNWSSNLFYDAGSVFNTPAAITVYRAAGAGISWQSPIGAINLYLSHPLHYPGGSWHVDISLGAFL